MFQAKLRCKYRKFKHHYDIEGWLWKCFVPLIFHFHSIALRINLLSIICRFIEEENPYKNWNLLQYTYHKHVFQAVFRWWWDSQHCKVTNKSGSDVVSTTTRGRTSCCQSYVL